MGVACDLGYPCAKLRLPRPFGFRVRADVRESDRQTDGRTTDAAHRLMPPPLRGGGIIMTTLFVLLIKVPIQQLVQLRQIYHKLPPNVLAARFLVSFRNYVFKKNE